MTHTRRSERLAGWLLRIIPVPRWMLLFIWPYAAFGVVCLILEATK